MSPPKNRMYKFHFIHNGKDWTLQRDGIDEPVEIYRDMDKQSALEQVSEDLKGLTATVWVHRMQTPSAAPSWHRPLSEDPRLCV